MKADELRKFKAMLLERREMLSGDVSKMGDRALGNTRQGASGDLSNMPIHMADIGSDNYEQEFTIDLIQNEEVEVREIDEALARVEDGTFGTCGSCGCRIPKERLKAIPYTMMCVKCKESEEVAAGGQ